MISHNLGEDNILCQITSQNIRKDNYTITLLQEETIEGSLMKDSYIRCEMLFTGNTKEIESRKICAINKETYTKVVNKIIEIIKEN